MSFAHCFEGEVSKGYFYNNWYIMIIVLLKCNVKTKSKYDYISTCG